MTYKYINDTVQNLMHVPYSLLAMYLSSLVITMLATTATLGNFFKQFEKVAKSWKPLTMMATYWRRTGYILAIICDGGHCGGISPQPAVASTLPAQFWPV